MTPERVPEGLLAAMQSLAGFDAKAFLAAQSNPPVTSIRLHPQKQSSAFADAEKIPWCPEGRYLKERPVFTLDPLLHAGAYYVQEASSQFLDYMLRALLPQKSNRRILDLCAAPGGKSTLIASLLRPDDLLIANEVIRTRAAILDENLSRWGYANTWASSNDPRDFSRLPGYFDCMVVDAPCSGSGLWRKDANAVDEWSEDAVRLCAARQKRILADAWPSLKEDGLLLYATCSFSPEEDEDILDWICGELQAEGIAAPVPEGLGITETQSPKHRATGYRFFPDKVKGEGFFIAALRKKNAAEVFYYPRFRTTRDKAATAATHTLMAGPELIALPDERRQYHAIHPWHEPDLYLLRDALYLRRRGLHLGESAGKDWLPAHDVALAVNRSPNVATLVLDKADALRFLKKEPLLKAAPGKGWYVITYENLGLGWIKALSGRSNNYLPKSRRIRMELPEENDS